MIFAQRENKALVILAAAGFFLLLGGTICAALIGWRKVPGLAGEWLGLVVGIFSTPFLLEAGALVGGATLLIAWNSWRRHREGDEWVYLEQANPAEIPPNTPDHAAWAIYREPPLQGEIPSELDQVEGALEIGDFPAAAEIMATWDAAKLQSPAALQLRIRLAHATGQNALARELEQKLPLPDAANPKSSTHEHT